ncbi:MAG TPA: ATP synthase subunit I [Kofleriaceae bacterium]|nr:ATP synthase subunit I [Kofleriaceae bacterium]
MASPDASAGAGIHRIERLNYAIGAVLVAAALLTQSRNVSLGIAIGAALTCVNFFVLRKLVVKWTRDAAAGRGGNGAVLMLPKMIGLMGAVALVILFLPINVVAFVIGYSIFIASIVIDATYSALRTPDVDPNDAPNPNSDEHNHG